MCACTSLQIVLVCIDGVYIAAYLVQRFGICLWRFCVCLILAGCTYVISVNFVTKIGFVKIYCNI